MLHKFDLRGLSPQACAMLVVHHNEDVRRNMSVWGKSVPPTVVMRTSLVRGPEIIKAVASKRIYERG